MTAGRITGMLLGLALIPATAAGQGLLISEGASAHRLPRPAEGDGYRIGQLAVDVTLVDQVARVQMAQSFVNSGSTPLEVRFVFPLPYDGAVEGLTLLVDGREVPGTLLAADEARRRFEEIARKNRDPALLEWMGLGMFQTSVYPVPPGAERKVTLRYTQVCRRDRGLTDFLFPLSTAKYTSQPLEKLTVRVAIQSGHDLKNVYSPSHAIDVERSDDRNAVASFTASNVIPQDDFRLLLDVGEGAVGASILSFKPAGDDDGYLLVLAAPELPTAERTPQAKTVVLVLDRSGSMTGEKFEQARAAARFVLSRLAADDHFAIVAYDTQVQSFRPRPVPCDEANRAAGLGFIEGLYAGGGTNIAGALQAAVAPLDDSSRPSYVFFLTDGLPTEGERSEPKIVEQCRSANRVRARVLCFGVGYDVNSRLLDGLARSNFGQTQYVRPSEDIESHVSRLYNRIESPVLNDVEVAVLREGTAVESGPAATRIYPAGPFDLFAGEQVALVGRYQSGGPITLVLEGSADGQHRRLEFKGQLADSSGDESYGFIAKLWAARRVGEIIDQLDLKGRNEELVKELVELSTRHGILTPYTSFLADESVELQEVAQNTQRALAETAALEETEGRAGVAQRAAKSALQLRQAAPASGFANYMGFDDANVVTDLVCNVGLKSFYRRGNRWVESTLSPEQLAKAQRIRQFSDQYFQLAARHGRQMSQYLAFDEPVVVNLGGQCYLVEPEGD